MTNRTYTGTATEDLTQVIDDDLAFTIPAGDTVTVTVIEGWAADQFKVTNGDVTVFLRGDHYLPVCAA